MLERLDDFLNLYTVIWLFPVAFMFHDLEEIITAERFLQKNRSKLTELLPPKAARMMEESFSRSSAQFAAAVYCIFIVLSVITFLFGQSIHSGAYQVLYTGCVTILFANAFTHIGQSICFRGYTPGVVTAVLIALPYSTYCLYRLLQEGLIDWSTVGLGFPVGLVLIIPLVYTGHRLGRLLVPDR